ncbi:family 43 glycosylhydrolase [Nocardioides jiangxiensis]|uniref:Family 43 glycosylhydrolase n=1 Tax=Nocardioides jiangxiensis TaxID=3064524 RepID=A0ABT9AZQ0_9ACTN|nr:family 43 glycosylhydrolase [Nocardioides sp. WY-20]MDO7868070.1 family 43 glycosylhydrolase [Nocardioides sp. WY-20]
MQAVRGAFVALVGSLVVVAGVVPGTAPAASAHHRGYVVTQLARGGLADPGPAQARGWFHLYGTGPGFPALRSRHAGWGYRAVGRAMPPGGVPRWFGTGIGGARHLWAPHVEVVRGRRGPVFLMYFAATRRGARDCIGVARSTSPTRGFRTVGRPLVCGGPGATAIDPSVYVGPHGRRWLTYVRRDHRSGVGQIRMVELGPAGLAPARGARSRLVVQNGRTITEAPSMLTRGGRTWLFVSRYSYRGCHYRTEVYRARTPGSRFVPAGPDHGHLVLRSRSGRTLCGAGGGEVLRTGRDVRFFFHAWRGGTESTGGRRVPFSTILRWHGGRPFVARR